MHRSGGGRPLFRGLIGGGPAWRGKWDAVLKVNNGVVPAPVPPQMACGCQVHAEAASFPHDEVLVRPVVRCRILVLRRKEGDQGSRADETLAYGGIAPDPVIVRCSD